MFWSIYRYRPGKAQDVHAVDSFLKPPICLLSLFLSYGRGNGNTEIKVSNVMRLSKASSPAPDLAFVTALYYSSTAKGHRASSHTERPRHSAGLAEAGDGPRPLGSLECREPVCAARLGPRQGEKRPALGVVNSQALMVTEPGSNPNLDAYQYITLLLHLLELSFFCEMKMIGSISHKVVSHNATVQMKFLDGT